MNITLLINEEEKTFSQFFVSAKYMRKALELKSKMNLNNLSIEDLDTVINFVVEVFGKQFNADDIYEGVGYEELITTVFDDIFMNILQGRKQEIKSKGNGKKKL